MELRTIEAHLSSFSLSDALPDAILRRILLKLLPSVSDILRFSSGCRAWRNFAFQDVELWKAVCETYFIEKAPPEPTNETDDDETVIAAKKRWYREAFTAFGVLNTSHKGYLDDYRRQYPVYQRRRRYLAQHSPNTLLTLQPGILLRRLLESDNKKRVTTKSEEPDSLFPASRAKRIQMFEPSSFGIAFSTVRLGTKCGFTSAPLVSLAATSHRTTRSPRKSKPWCRGWRWNRDFKPRRHRTRCSLPR